MAPEKESIPNNDNIFQLTFIFFWNGVRQLPLTKFKFLLNGKLNILIDQVPRGIY